MWQFIKYVRQNCTFRKGKNLDNLFYFINALKSCSNRGNIIITFFPSFIFKVKKTELGLPEVTFDLDFMLCNLKWLDETIRRWDQQNS